MTAPKPLTIPADLVQRARKAEADFGASFADHELARMAAENARLDVIRELWAFVAVGP